MLRSVVKRHNQYLNSQVENTKLLIDLLSRNREEVKKLPIKNKAEVPELSSELPKSPRAFSNVLKDIEEKILPNNIYWNHPMFFAFFPMESSWSAIQGEILSKSLQSNGFLKNNSPASFKVEMIVSDWLAEMLGFPKHFYNKNGPGGGITYATASDAVLTAMSCARLETRHSPVVYASDQAHFSVQKAARVLGLEMRTIPSSFNESFGNYSIDIQLLKDQIVKDRAAGLKPSFILGCLGGTNTSAIDQNDILAEIAEEEKAWFHIDAAYAGSFCILPEFKYLLKGVEKCTTFNMNSSKMLLTGINSSHMWFKDKELIIRNLSQGASYLRGNEFDLKNWQIPLSRDYKAYKSWFVIQELGESGIVQRLRNYVEAGKVAEEYVKNDPRLEMVVKRILSLVVFRVKGENEKTDHLVNKLVSDENILLLGSKLFDKSIIRFTPGNITEGNSNIHEAFRIIFSYLD